MISDSKPIEISEESCPIDKPSCCGGKPVAASREHWENTYLSSPPERLGWYESQPGPCLELVRKCGLEPSDPILVAGAGASTLIDSLLDAGHQEVIATDISESGLQVLRQRLGTARASRVSWIADDLAHPKKLTAYKGQVALWHDRAVLHFLTEEEDQKAYFDLLRMLLRPGGYVILAEYAIGGATKCNGLPVVNYDTEMLAQRLGKAFKLADSFYYTYLMPSGEKRKYIYTRFQHQAPI